MNILLITIILHFITILISIKLTYNETVVKCLKWVKVKPYRIVESPIILIIGIIFQYFLCLLPFVNMVIILQNPIILKNLNEYSIKIITNYIKIAKGVSKSVAKIKNSVKNKIKLCVKKFVNILNQIGCGILKILGI